MVVSRYLGHVGEKVTGYSFYFFFIDGEAFSS